MKTSKRLIGLLLVMTMLLGVLAMTAGAQTVEGPNKTKIEVRVAAGDHTEGTITGVWHENGTLLLTARPKWGYVLDHWESRYNKNGFARWDKPLPAIRKSSTLALTPDPRKGFEYDEYTAYFKPVEKLEIEDFLGQNLIFGGVPNKPMHFSDVRPGDWYFEAVDELHNMDLMGGVGGGKFGADLPITRGMLVTLLWRMEEYPMTGTECPFDDVAKDSYYEDAITWAQGFGVVKGMTKTTFAPDAPVTREQMAAILFRYASYRLSNPYERKDLEKFEDADQVQDYAVEAMSWACGNGILKGSKGLLDPQGVTTRAEAAVMLYRVLEK